MKLYLAYCNDRHCDPEFHLFKNPSRAMGYAKQFMLDNMAHPEGITVNEIEGFLCHYGYIEDDCAYVVEVEVKE